MAQRAVWGAIFANLVIALAKFDGYRHTSSAAMFSEGVHSLVDAGNGSLLLVGLRLSRRPADETHPFGYGKELYFWTLIVALLVFALGGGISIWEGVRAVRAPELLHRVGWNYAILAMAFVFEGSSLLVALGQFRAGQPPGGSIWSAIHRSKDPSTFTIIFEDSAALVGLTIAFLGLLSHQLFGWAGADGVASIAIGVLLMMVALLLVSESRALLVGEGADRVTLRRIRQLALADPAVERAGYPMTMYFGPHNVLLTMDIQFGRNLSGTLIEQAVDRVEAAIRAQFPEVRYIYLEVEAVRSVPRGEEITFPAPEEPPAE
ncbi:MAG TPA: cation diffusion facilitator family transporter [Terriglobales bacterium]|nr:cation diffusion facilitator family transporter [Terriglobales bacterium]